MTDTTKYPVFYKNSGDSYVTDGTNRVNRPFYMTHMVSDDQMRAELVRMQENEKEGAR